MLRMLVRPTEGVKQVWTAITRFFRRIAAPIAVVLVYELLSGIPAVGATCNVSVVSLVHQYAITTAQPGRFYDAPDAASFTRLIICADSARAVAIASRTDAPAAIALLRSMPQRGLGRSRRSSTMLARSLSRTKHCEPSAKSRNFRARPRLGDTDRVAATARRRRYCSKRRSTLCHSWANCDTGATRVLDDI